MAFDVLSLPSHQRALIEASAGTGKTYAISTLFVRLLLERDLDVDQLLVVTFTEAATAELKQRVRQRLGDALALCEAFESRGRPKSLPIEADDLVRILDAQGDWANSAHKLQQALYSFDDVAIFTIHGFCHRALRENTFATRSSFDAELIKDLRPLTAEAMLDFWAREVATASVEFVRSLAAAGFSPSTLENYANWVAQTRDVAAVPEPAGDPDEPSLEPLQRAYLEARAVYEPDSVKLLLLESGLNGTRYPVKRIGGWCRELDGFFVSDRVNTAFPEHFHKFGTCSLAAARTKKTVADLSHPFFGAIDELSNVRDAYIADMSLCIIAFQRRLIAFLNEQLAARKLAQRVVSFDDLLHQLAQSLGGPGGNFLAGAIRARYPIALIDEFQDTDPCQYSIFDRIYAGERASLFMIGDPKQAIYSFRGADVFAYLEAAESVPEAQRLTMTTNYRSAPELVAAVNALFDASSLPFYFPEIAYPHVEAREGARQPLTIPGAPNSAPLQFRFLRGSRKDQPGHSLDRRFKERTLPRLVAAEVVQLLDSPARIDNRKLTPRDFAILTRTNAEAFDCQRALQSLGIPGVVLGDRSVYEYEEARDLELLLSAIVEPTNARALRTALMTDLLGQNASALMALDENELEWDEWVNKARAWNQRWLNHGFVQMTRQVLADCNIAERLLELTDGERRMTNLLHLIELLHTEAIRSHLGPSGVLRYLGEQRGRQYSPSDSEQIRLESDDDAVVLTTIHKSKGLEYPIVICPTLHNGMLTHHADELLVRFHDREAGSRLTLDLGSTKRLEHQEQMRVEALAENLRLLYVALTRAKYRCIVFWGPFRDFGQSALAYLLHARQITTGTEPPTISALKTHVSALTNDELLQRLRDLDPAGTTIGVSEPDPSHAPPHFSRTSSTREQLRCRTIVAEQRQPALWPRTSSFSSLASHDSQGHDPLEGRDLDTRAQLLAERQTTILLSEQPGNDRLVTLADFPGGKATGNLYHSLLEHCDFQVTDHSQLVQRTLREHGYAEAHSPLIAKSLAEVLTTEFAPGLSLSKVATQQRLNELEFTLPATAVGGAPALSAQRLAEVFRTHPSEAVSRQYADRVGRLGFAPLSGFLKGFVDLIFTHEDRWYVVDYKTNNLGARYGDYRPPQVTTAMVESHYVLQYHLYTLALHRYLSTRIGDYNYELHFGGAYYLFLRGMHPEHGPAFGVFGERPPLARLDALSAIFTSRGGVG
jgi:exodeoxyribonuclease V beta subunit